VVDGIGPIEEYRLLDHPLPDDLGEEVYIFLRATRARRQVVKPTDEVHLTFPSFACKVGCGH
jgi:hypothetical protein